MAYRSRRCLFAVLTALVVTACAADGVGDTPITRPSAATSSTTATLPATTTTSTLATTTSTLATTTTTLATPTTLATIDANVSVPEGDGPFPSVVLVHGGGWVTGDPGIMQPLATYLNENGYLTVNVRYTLASFETAGFPSAIEDVACAVRYAASHPDSDGTVAVIGHSAGAHIGAVVALTGEDYEGDCGIGGSGVPDRFVGLAGPYDVSRVGLAAVPFFGGGPAQFPLAWEEGNPQLLADGNPDLESLIMYGERDVIVPASFAVDFHEALTESGSESLLELVEGALHLEMHNPDVVGDLIVTWLDR